jgi:hypothetical protein
MTDADRFAVEQDWQPDVAIRDADNSATTCAAATPFLSASPHQLEKLLYRLMAFEFENFGIVS